MLANITCLLLTSNHVYQYTNGIVKTSE